MDIQSIKNISDLRHKRVLARVDFNTPINNGQVADDTRIKAALPTIEFLIEKGAKVVLMTHLAHPKTKKQKSKKAKKQFDLGPIVERLGELLKRKVELVEDWNFEEIKKAVKKMKDGQVLMLPNLRLHQSEEKNSEEFARELAGLGQIFVNEAFSVCHREHASVVGVPKFLPSYAGLRLVEETETLGRVLYKPEKPLIALMGGGKIMDKMAMLKTMTKRADAVLVGGALAVHFFKAMGCGVGASNIDPRGAQLAKRLLKNKKIILPCDVVVGRMIGKEARVVEFPLLSNGSFVAEQRKFSICKKPYAILDIGPKTILQFSRYIKTARTLVWNGPMGLYEIKPYSHGTMALGRLFASRSRGKTFGIVGGGETIDALNKTGMSEYVDFISTGGGAMLAYLGGEELPGITALVNNK